MKNTDNLDMMAAAIREESLSAEAAEQAARNVRARLFARESGSAGPGALRDCAGFRALIPSYLNRTLSPAKALLLTDHTHSCVACNRAVENARSGNLRVLARPTAVSSRVSTHTKWAIAAMVALGVGLAGWGVVRSMLPAPGVRATVQTVDGTLFQLASFKNTPVFAGRTLGDRETVRTVKNSTALLRLADGSSVEMNERSQLAVSRAARGTTIHLDHGNIIVHAAKQRGGALYVKTADCEVMVKGTVFAVLSGTKGSRVSVVEGSVKVDQGSQTVLLKPGDQVTTSDALARTSVAEDVAWSRDAAQYLAALGELSGLQKQVEQIAGPGLRTSSRLLDYVPADTAIYAALPNVGSTIGETWRLFNQRLQSSSVLQQWWQQQGQHGTDLQAMVERVERLSSYLGDEIVVAVPADSDGAGTAAIVIAEVKNPGLAGVLETEIATTNARSGRQTMQLLQSAAALPSATAAANGGLVYLQGGFVALSTNPALLRDLAAKIQQPASAPKLEAGGIRDRISQAYQSGVGWLFCADLAQLPGRANLAKGQRIAADVATGGARYLVFERNDAGGQIRNQATFSFSGPRRRGIASWLAAPAAMSTLDFTSPDASLAASFVINNPGALIASLIGEAEAKNADLAARINQFQAQSGVNIVNDLATPLGGEMTVSIDGPLLPVPSWKLAVELSNPTGFEWAIERLVNALNVQLKSDAAAEGAQVLLTQAVSNGRTIYTLKASGGPAASIPAEIDYTYVDGYLLAAANQNLLTTAIQNRSTGYTLVRSEKFRSQMPHDGNTNFSALVYHNAGGIVGPLIDQLKSLNALSPDQKQALANLQANSAPGLIYAYAEPGQIRVAANGSLFGFSLDSLALPTVLHNLMQTRQSGHLQSQ